MTIWRKQKKLMEAKSAARLYLIKIIMKPLNNLEGLNMADELGRDDFAKWVDMWDKAQEEGIFPTQPELLKPEAEIDNAYWAYYDETKGKLLTEDHAGPAMNRKDLADQAKDMAKVPNPVYHHTLG